jgi:homeobox protein cut-like
MNFLKQLDQALDFESLEKTVTAKVSANLLSEFPDRHRALPTTSLSTAAALVESRDVSEAWRAFAMEVRGRRDTREALQNRASFSPQASTYAAGR